MYRGLSWVEGIIFLFVLPFATHFCSTILNLRYLQSTHVLLLALREDVSVPPYRAA
jgi:hypothetical protein